MNTRRNLERCIFLTTVIVVSIVAAAILVPTVKAYTITVDGDPSDWLADTTAQGNNTFQEYLTGSLPYSKEFVWKDELGDDTGNGSYLYPATGGFTGGEADLLEFRATWDANYLYMLFKFADLTGLANGTAIGVGIDTDNKPDSGMWWAPPSLCDAVYLNGSVIWPEYELVIAGASHRLMNTTWAWICVPPELLVANSTTNNVFEVGIPTSVIGDPGSKIWKFSVLIGVTNMHQEDIPGYGNAAEVFAGDPATNTHPNNPGGGIDDWTDPDIFDMAFYPNKATQEAELNDYAPGWPNMARIGKRGGYQAIGFYNQQQAELYVGASANPNVYDPLNITLPSVSTTFTVYIKTRNITNLWCMGFSMNYNPAVLNCTAVCFGASWGVPWVDCVFILGTINRTKGSIEEYAAARTTAALPINATLFEVDFHVLDTVPLGEVSILQIYCKPIDLIDKDLMRIYVPMTDGRLWGVTRRDIAIIKITAPEKVVRGRVVDIRVTLENQGTLTENFTLYGWYSGPLDIFGLPPKTNTTIIYSVDTSSIPPGNYTLWAYVLPCFGDQDPYDNIYVDGVLQVIVHDVAVIAKKTFSSKHGPPGSPLTPITECYSTWIVEISVTVQNQGTVTEAFTVQAFYGNATGNYTIGIVPASYPGVTLAPGASTTKTFTWDVPLPPWVWPYWTYTIYANVSVVSGETDTADNTLDRAIVTVKWIGDANGDGWVNIYDLTKLALSWKKPISHPKYNPQCDINGDGYVDIFDLTKLALNWRNGPRPPHPD